MKKKTIVFLCFMVVMIVLGASDSLRGIFALMFQEHFKLSNFQVSLIITVSYIGNLIFLFFGGAFIDRSSKKRAFITVLCIWLCGALLFVLTDHYIVLLVGMFLCMGASTLLNTTINILVPTIFLASPGFIVNVLFFVQGIGTSTSQNAIGHMTMNFTSWKIVNIILILMAVLGLLLISRAEITEVKQQGNNKVSYGSIMKTPAFLLLVLIFGFYFIAEHGTLNWFILYGTKELGLNMEHASLYLSLFFGGITLGRFLFAPMVQTLGIGRSIGVFGSIGTILYIIGVLLGNQALALLSVSGLCISIVYPTLVLLIRNYYDMDRISTATGAIISCATIFDIGFNMVFGKLVDYVGLKISFLILPVSMAIFCTLYLIFQKSVKPITRD